MEVCKWLARGGVSVDDATNDGTTPFHWAVWQGQFGAARWLVDSEADWRKVNDWGCNAVHWAALQGNLPMCRWLGRLGLDLCVANNQGHTALHKAAYKGHVGLCRWLFEHTLLGPIMPGRHSGGANVCGVDSGVDNGGGGACCCAGFALDGGGYTADLIAHEQGHLELSEWLTARRTELVATATAGCTLAAMAADAEKLKDQRADGLAARPKLKDQRADGLAARPKLVLTGPLGKLEQQDELPPHDGTRRTTAASEEPPADDAAGFIEKN
eukprot:SAG22_NODE_901_length_6600_cov_1.945854_10_plen_270_part_00